MRMLDSLVNLLSILAKFVQSSFLDNTTSDLLLGKLILNSFIMLTSQKFSHVSDILSNLLLLPNYYINSEILGDNCDINKYIFEFLF